MRGKHLGTRHPYTDQRDKELLKAYHRSLDYLLQRDGHIEMTLAVDMARFTPCSRYFVSEEVATKIIKQIECGKTPKMGRTRRNLFRYLYDRYLALKAQYPTDTLRELVVMACASRAPHFFITRDSAYQLISLIKRNLKKTGIPTSNQSL